MNECTQTVLIVLLILLCTTISYKVYSTFLEKKRLKTKLHNDERMKKIREKQIEIWEKENKDYRQISQYKSGDNETDERCNKNGREGYSKPKDVPVSRLNPHFSYLASYRPSGSRRRICKKCCSN
ncbi:uncharacterized protein CMU_028570 [Cryptosporidium muris RN66]|uniref:Uncharacterized protein n=1 Tax=Cryptosporidium muris (strain RN66) TaxID=441375 RepID=B6AHU2_CRYMR|nr:uncharacterized protein CMU_028570 [Cryptosporidium muris RN66]EEA07783.1 hypothetical protein, conserved [Cryptosporidium muris RN66]|eukprot:XP_002142132.1 hypothetical protein [Cryptosporidium muris RN66]